MGNVVPVSNVALRAKAWSDSSRAALTTIRARVPWRSAGLWLLLPLYVVLGIHSQVSHLVEKPLPDFLMEDYGYYARAFARLQAGDSPYADRAIGTAFLYPPQALLLVGAFEVLGPLPIKFAAYATLSLLALAGSFALVAHACRVRASEPRLWAAVVLAFAFAPVGWSLYLGQVNLLVAFTVVAGFFLADRRPHLAGAAIAIGTAIKLTPVLLLITMLDRRYVPVHAAFVVTSLVLALTTGVMLGFEHFGAYVNVARMLGQSFPVGFGPSLSLLNTFYLLAGALALPRGGWLDEAQLAYAAGIVGLLLAGAWLTRDQRDRHLLYALVVLGLTLVPNLLWYHHLVFLTAALLTLLLSPQSTSTLRVGAVAAFAAIQLDRVLSPKLDKFTTTPVCLLLLVLVLARLAARARSPAR